MKNVERGVQGCLAHRRNDPENFGGGFRVSDIVEIVIMDIKEPGEDR